MNKDDTGELFNKWMNEVSDDEDSFEVKISSRLFVVNIDS